MKAILIFILSCFVTLTTAQTRINELPAKTNADSTWLFLTGNPVSGKLYKITGANLRDSVFPKTDTTSLSNRIDLKLKATDTSSLSNRIDAIGTTAANGDLEVNNNIIANDRNANKVTIGSVSPDFQQYPGIWFGSATPTITNYAFLADVASSFTILNAPYGGTIALRINNTTTMNISSVVNLASSARQVFADDAAAGAGGLVTGDIYQTSAGVLMIKQ